MGIARLNHQSKIQMHNAVPCHQPICQAAKEVAGGQYSPHEIHSAGDFSSMPMIRRLFSDNEVSLDNGLFVIIFGFTAIVLLVCCLTARRRRFSTLVIGSVLILTYFSIGFGFVDPHWIEGRPKTAILTTYCFYSKGHLVQADLRINIGLSFFNVSYSTFGHSVSGKRKNSQSTTEYQEKFLFAQDKWAIDYNNIADAKREALSRGLPNPIISVAEFLGTHGHGFRWGPKLTVAGEGAKICLEFALAAIVIASILLVVVPKHGLLIFPVTGVLMVISSIIYSSYCPTKSEQIYIEGISIALEYGRTIYLVFIVGILDTTLGTLALLLLRFRLCLKFSTFLELHYDTPWSNQLIAQDMKTRSQKDDLVHTAFRKSVHRWRETIRRRKSLPSELVEEAIPKITVNRCDDLPRRSILIRESVRRFRSLSNHRKTKINYDKKSNESISDCSNTQTEFDQVSENKNGELKHSSESNLPDLIKGNENGVFVPVWI